MFKRLLCSALLILAGCATATPTPVAPAAPATPVASTPVTVTPMADACCQAERAVIMERPTLQKDLTRSTRTVVQQDACVSCRSFPVTIRECGANATCKE